MARTDRHYEVTSLWMRDKRGRIFGNALLLASFSSACFLFSCASLSFLLLPHTEYKYGVLVPYLVRYRVPLTYMLQSTVFAR